MLNSKRTDRQIHLLRGIALSVVCLVCGQTGANCQEIEPREFKPADTGTNLNLIYYVHSQNSRFYTTSGRGIPDSNLQVDLGLERFVHYTSLGGMTAGFQIYQGAGASSGHLGGAGLSPTVGATNTALSAFLWPYENAAEQQYLVFAGFVYPPDGSYDKNKVLGLAPALSSWQGWTGDLQIGWDHAIGTHFSYDAAIDGRFFADTSGPIQPGVPISVRQHKSAELRAQLWLNWAWNEAFTTSIGYEGFFGGSSYFDQPSILGGQGHINTGKSFQQRVRAAGAVFLSPRFQVLLEGNHDVARAGGFKQDWGVILRTLYLF